MTPDRLFGVLGAAMAFVAIGAGAFGAHALRARLSAELLAVFETASRYLMYHALALFVAAWSHARWQAPQIAWAGWLFVFGTLLFCGSLYVLSLSGARWWGAITPFGGVAFLAGWGLLAWGIAAGR